MARRRACANAADYLSGHRGGSSRRLGRGARRRPLDALCADGGSPERSVRVGGNQTARRTIILWRSRKAPLPPRANGSAKAPVKTSPGPCLWAIRNAGRSPPQPACAVALSVGATNLPAHAIHHVAGGDDRMGRAGTVVGVALFYAIRRNEGDAKIAIHIGADDRLVVARDRPRERLLGIGGRGRRA